VHITIKIINREECFNELSSNTSYLLVRSQKRLFFVDITEQPYKIKFALNWVQACVFTSSVAEVRWD